jgi:hypothetical protein
MIVNNDYQTDSALSEEAENVLYTIAENMGILVTEEEADAITKYLDTPLSEAANIVRLNNQAKLSGFTVRNALVLAQQKKDPLFAKYAKAAALKRSFRGMIVKKYQGQATINARKLLANAGKRNMVDISQKTPLSSPDTKAT